MSAGRFTAMTVIVTGAAGGLGSAIVEAFAAEGARVLATDISYPDASEADGESIVRRRLDVTDEHDWIALMDACEEEFGAPDVLVNNAGIYRPNIAFEDMPIDLWRRHFAVNSDGTFLGCKHAIRRMKPRGRGAIVNMGSGMSIKSNPSGAAYCGSKAAVLMTTRTAAGAAGPYGIRVNAVLPGAVPTAMLMGNKLEDDTDASLVARLEAHSALGRLATAEDIARGVLFLAAPESAAITGVYLPIDGGNMPGA
ncbi:hypothetical protein B2G71_22565 [Novosphingobium sp. PC22D]|uniref:SDR family NAD(P)-dependent oxidoreductase n=1 Tax=Novosphingobium sp. PC22D TaxID=1962403 RepID=UPI000BFAE6D5|nr:SDR family oxidoreductase [Novosphingobium sp. PC22D]PEQ10408.1 hypothetical protein B2G71_22565 [Novosphingobium sp. PC22D]